MSFDPFKGFITTYSHSHCNFTWHSTIPTMLSTATLQCAHKGVWWPYKSPCGNCSA